MHFEYFGYGYLWYRIFCDIFLDGYPWDAILLACYVILMEIHIYIYTLSYHGFYGYHDQIIVVHILGTYFYLIR